MLAFFVSACAEPVETLNVEFAQTVVTTDQGEDVEAWPLGFGCRMGQGDLQGAWIQPPETACSADPGDNANSRALDVGYLVFTEAIRQALENGTSDGLCMVTDVISWSGSAHTDLSALFESCERRLIDCQLRSRKRVRMPVPADLLEYVGYLSCEEGENQPWQATEVRDALVSFLGEFRTALLASPDVTGGVVAQSVPDLSLVRVFGTTKSCDEIDDSTIINPVGGLVGDFRTIVGVATTQPMSLSAMSEGNLQLDHVPGGVDERGWCDACDVCRSTMSPGFCDGLTIDNSSLPPGAVAARFPACERE